MNPSSPSSPQRYARLRACSWEPTHTLKIPGDWVSGVYLGKLSSLAGVREFPVRVKCASLAWHTLKAAMAQQPKVSTE